MQLRRIEVHSRLVELNAERNRLAEERRIAAAQVSYMLSEPEIDVRIR